MGVGGRRDKQIAILSEDSNQLLKRVGKCGRYICWENIPDFKWKTQKTDTWASVCVKT